MPTLVKVNQDKIETMLRKSGKDWDAAYKGQDGMMHYMTSAPTKDDLIHKLIRKVVKLEQR